MQGDFRGFPVVAAVYTGGFAGRVGWFRMPSVSLSVLLSAVLPVFLVMGTGAYLRRMRVLTPQADHALLGLVMHVAYPCFILHAVVGNEALQRPENVWLPLGCGAGFMLAGGLVAWLCAPVFALPAGAPRRTFALACSIQNYGYLPIPILSALVPAGGWMGVLFVFSLGMELVLWTAGVWLMSPGSRGALRNMVNPVVMSIVAGLALNALPLGGWFPPGSLPPWPVAVVIRATGMLGECAIVLGLLIVGATLGDLMGRPNWLGDWRTAAGGVVMRLAVVPAIMLAVLASLPAAGPDGPWYGATREFLQVGAVQAAMPAAVFPMVIARRYGGDEAVAMRVILGSTIVSLFTIPFTVRWALHWLVP